MILLVTHEVGLAKQISRLLEAQGYPVLLASRGSDVETLVARGIFSVAIGFPVQSEDRMVRQIESSAYFANMP